jgi:hypothetical protein
MLRIKHAVRVSRRAAQWPRRGRPEHPYRTRVYDEILLRLSYIYIDQSRTEHLSLFLYTLTHGLSFITVVLAVIKKRVETSLES